jgi:hypothetical protein
MKKLIIAIVCLVDGVFAMAQSDPQQTQTLFRNPQHIGWYVAPEFGYTRFDDKDVFLSGVSGGVIFNHSFSLGLAGYGIVNSSSLQYSDIIPPDDLYLYGGYGGLKMEYRMFPSKVTHVSFPLLIGGGALSYNRNNDMNYNYMEESYASDGFFVLEPGVMLGVNLIKFMRLDVGVTYRFAPNIDLPNTSAVLLNTFNAMVSLKFGKF